MRSMACCASPRAIIWVKTRRCWSRKKSSGLRFSMAALRALLSRMTAPRTERSASRLLGSGFSRVASVGMGNAIFALFSPTITQTPFEAQDRVGAGRDDFVYFAGGEECWTRPIPCLLLRDLLRALCAGEERASIGVAVHRFGKCAKVFCRRRSKEKVAQHAAPL